ncbi:hypothetical protein [Sphingomonas sp.]|uniref:hypothetical protein n=1 Tax=Sphingomonas sp. TaxID=28214 RepID=UPI002B7E9D2B|nr:hypothetical protein [Sphingomonas sp.]HTG39153.1 hypothetical protein [Sphingomonas sp.]
MRTLLLAMTALALPLTACGGAPERPANDMASAAPGNIATSMGGDVAAVPGALPTTAPPTAAPATPAPATPIPQGPKSCAAEIGEAAAARLAEQCRMVSPATRPPCNAANSCAMIRDEIARSCDLFRDDPPAECGNASEGERAADVVRRYYDAINARDYSVAYAQWSGRGAASGKSYDAFAAGFADTRSVTVTAREPADVEGGAGSLYAEVPVTVDAALADGKRQRFTGAYVIRRVNDVDGASTDQRRWHIDSAKLTPA